jgi:hypothetical protein
MLFKCGLSEPQLQALDKSLLNSAVNELLRAHRLGYHLLVLERPTANVLMDILDLTLSDRSTLSRVSNDYTQSGNLAKNASVYIELVDGIHTTCVNNSICYPIIKISPSQVGNATNLVVENEATDGYLYSFILQNIRPCTNLPRMSFELVHGGGEDIQKVFE